MYMIDKYGGCKLNAFSEENKSEYIISSLWQQYTCSSIFAYYDEFLRLCSDLLKEISIPDNPISILENMSNLLWQGLFSYGNVFEYAEDIKSTFSVKLGIDVVLGKGVCRHVSSFATDLLQKMGIYCDDFYCYSSDTKIMSDLMGEANHMANLIKYDGNYYVYDILINKLLSFASPIELEDFEDELFFYYKPEKDIELGCISLIDLENRLKEFESSTGSSTISRSEYYEIIRETSSLYVKNICLLPDFCKESNKLKEKIHSSVRGVIYKI